MQTSKRAAPPDRRNAAEGQHHGCACIGKCNPCRCTSQAEQPAAFWREVSPNKCADCGKLIGDDWTSYDNDRMSDRGRLWCDPCTMRREVAR
jgi:hypothetical protein